ncbi:hypothetical protein KC315_g11902, partial [Hortaea werneckii]
GGGGAAATIDDTTTTAERASGPRETTGPHHHDEAGGESGASKAGVTTATSSSTSPNTPTQPAPHDLDNQGCSICTDDFEIGQDQRVLPCNHRFHPACIDPWLLNVSGTCPLCRIDLRPTQAEGDGEQEQELDENGNPIPPRPNGDDEQLPPPLGSEAGAGGTTTQRMGVRRSLVVGILGLRGAPERMSREERVGALRAYRERQAVLRRGRGGGEVDAARGQEGVGAEAEDGVVGYPALPQQELNGNENENGARLRDRLRRTFRIRTRRAGGPGPGPTARGRGEEEEEEVGETIPATTTATAAAADGGTRRPNVTS